MLTNGSKVLIEFPHGLGDGIQFSVVLQHLKEEFPNSTIDVLSGRGKHSCFHGLARKSLIRDHDLVTDVYDQTIHIDWWECDHVFLNAPSTKASKCLHDVFGIQPKIKPYALTITDHARSLADAYIATIPTRPFVLIHYQGNTSANFKNLNHSTIKTVCSHLLTNGFTPVILDWDHRSMIPDQRNVFCPTRDNPLWEGTGTGDASILGALIEKADLFIGVDSGPLHVAQATSTPTIACWVRHHPIHFCDVSGNVVHLVPAYHENLIKGDRKAGMEFFQKHYRFTTYDIINSHLLNLVNDQLGIEEKIEIEATNPYIDKDYLYDDARGQGLDYAFYGEWQDQYGVWFVDSLKLHDKTVLDVGCACGSISQGIQKAGATVHAIDHNFRMVEIGKREFSLASMNCCDAANLHLFNDCSIDVIHLSHTLAGFRHDQVSMILNEFRRVLKRGGLVFSLGGCDDCFDSEFSTLGYVNVLEDYLGTLTHHPYSKVREYNWRFQIFRKP